MISPFSTLSELSAALACGETTSTALCQQYLTRIAASTIGAVVIPVSISVVLAAAAASDARRAARTTLSAIDGIPYTLKMIHQTNGVQTCNGTTAVDWTPTTDGDIQAKLQAAGAVFLGKTNLGLNPAQTINQVFAETHNPRAFGMATGGSCGGPAAAVAAGLTGFDIGVDAAGSVRIPSSFCGVYGHKATNKSIAGYGSYGLMPSTPPMGLDAYTFGPITRSLTDLLLLLPIIAGPSAMEPYIGPLAAPTNPELSSVVQVNTIGPEWNLSPFVQTLLNALTAALAAAGVTVTQGSMPWFAQADFDNIYQAIQEGPEAIADTYPNTTNPWFAGQLSWAGQPETQSQGRAEIWWLQELIQRLLAQGQVIVTGTTALSPPTYGSAPNSATWIAYEAFTGIFNLTNFPAVTLPLGIDPATGVSCGVQLIGQHYRDLDLLSLAAKIETIGLNAGVLPGYTQPSVY
jgi:amidase